MHTVRRHIIDILFLGISYGNIGDVIKDFLKYSFSLFGYLTKHFEVFD